MSNLEGINKLILSPDGAYTDSDGGSWTKKDRVWYDAEGRSFRDLPGFPAKNRPLTDDEQIAHAYAWLVDLGLQAVSE